MALPLPAPGAPDSQYFPYLTERLCAWVEAHPDDTPDGVQGMAQLAIALREATRDVSGKGRRPSLVYAQYYDWLMGGGYETAIGLAATGA